MKTNLFADPILVVKDLNYRYDKNGPKVLKNVNFQLLPNSHLTILGHNGSGKTTLGKIIAGLIHHFDGTVKLFGDDMQQKSRLTSQEQTRVGLIFQNPESQFISLTVENDLAFGLENLQLQPLEMIQKIKAIVQQFNLEPLFNEEAANLSDGNKQKVAIASVLICNPQMVIFDEPTSMVDQASEQEINRLIGVVKNQDINVIEITHNIERLLVADQVLLLERGKVKYFGPAHQLLTTHSMILEECSGLKLPFVARLIRTLNQIGFNFKTTYREAQLVKEICQKLKS